MKAVHIVGYSNSGKTTLISRLAECLEARGLRVAIAKHTRHPLDKPDTDTALLTRPGRTIIGLSNLREGGGEAMLLWERPRALAELVPLLDAHVLLVEGGTLVDWLPRILCLRSAEEVAAALPNGLDELKPALAIATYGEYPLEGLPAYTAEQMDELANQVLEQGLFLPDHKQPDAVSEQAEPSQRIAVSLSGSGVSLEDDPITQALASALWKRLTTVQGLPSDAALLLKPQD